MKFVHLQTHHASALERFLLDFEDQSESNIPAYFAKRDWRHQRIVDTLMAWSKGELLPQAGPRVSLFLRKKRVSESGYHRATPKSICA